MSGILCTDVLGLSPDALALPAHRFFDLGHHFSWSGLGLSPGTFASIGLRTDLLMPFFVVLGSRIESHLLAVQVLEIRRLHPQPSLVV